MHLYNWLQTKYLPLILEVALLHFLLKTKLNFDIKNNYIDCSIYLTALVENIDAELLVTVEVYYIQGFLTSFDLAVSWVKILLSSNDWFFFFLQSFWSFWPVARPL